MPPPLAGARAAGWAACLAACRPSRCALQVASESPDAGGGGAQGRGVQAVRGAGPGRAPARAVWCPRMPRRNAISSSQED